MTTLFELATAMTRFDAALVAQGVPVADRDAIIEAVVRSTIVAGPEYVPPARRERPQYAAGVSDFMADGDRIADDLALHAHLDA